MIILLKILIVLNILILAVHLFLFLKYGKKSAALTGENVNDNITTIIPLKNISKSDFKNIIKTLEIKSTSEVIVSLESKEEKYYDKLKSLRKNYPKLKIVIAGSPGNNMPKTNNIRQAYKYVTNEFIVIKDADVIPNEQVYKDLYRKIKKPKAGGGFAPAFYIPAGSLGGWLVNIVTNYFFTQTLYFVANENSFKFLAGAFMMVKKSAIEKFDAFDGIIDNITDDASLGKKLADNSFDIYVSDYPVFMNAPESSLREAFINLKRWIVIIKKFFGIKYILLLPLFYPGNSFVLLVSSLITGEFVRVSIAVFIFSILFKLSVSVFLDKIIFKKVYNLLVYFTVLIFGILQPFAWAMFICSNSLSWAGRKFKIGNGGKILEVKSVK